jgi:hypothetical protein
VGSMPNLVQRFQRKFNFREILRSLYELLCQNGLRRSSNAKESNSDDILLTIPLLKPLGSGFTIITLAGQQFIRSVPAEFSTDQTTVLEAIHVTGFVSVVMLRVNLKWDRVRAETVLDDLVSGGLVWIDKQGENGQTLYWGASVMSDGLAVVNLLAASDI